LLINLLNVIDIQKKKILSQRISEKRVEKHSFSNYFIALILL